MTVSRTKGLNRRQPQVSDNIRAAVLGVVDTDGKRKPAEAPTAQPAQPAAPKQPMRINRNVLSRAKRMTRAQQAATAQVATEVFKPYAPAPGVLPAGGEPTLAMDTALQSWAQESYSNSWNTANPFGGAFAEGVGFLGYAYLSELTQRPEYRRISERIATEMTRKWIRLTIAGEADDDSDDEDADSEGAEDKAPAKGAITARDPKELDDPEDDEDEPDADGDEEEDEDEGPTPEELAQRKRNEALQKKLKKIDADMKRLDVRCRFKTVAEFDGWMGRSHLYIDTGDSDDADELLTDLGNGSDETSKTKFKKGSLRGIKHVEPIWCYPVNYNANDPLADDWYNPQVWFAMAKRIHVSRLLTFVGRPLPDILKPAYAFGGLSMSQMAKPYVDNWLRTRQAVTALIESFSVSGVYTNAQSLLQGGGEEVLDRIELFNVGRSNAGTMVLDKDTEEFFNITTPLGTLDALQAQSQEQMSSVSGIPLIVLLGITPTGLNASSEGELRVFYDYIHAMQESLFRDKLKRIIDFIQLNLFGEVDPAIGFEFEPLWSLDEKGEAEVEKIKMETRSGYVDLGSVSNEEVRKILIDDEDSEFTGLEPDDMPDLKQEEQDGLVPGGGGMGGKGAAGGNNDNREVEGAADEMVELAADIYAFDDGSGNFDESKHKRDPDGKFSETGGGAAGAAPELTFKTKKEQAGHMLLKGTTPKAIMQALGWTKLSMPATAASLGMKLEKYTENGVVKYKGTPLTDAEKAAAKAEAKGKETDKQAQQILKNAGLSKETPPPKNWKEHLAEEPKAEPKKPMIPPATGPEMEKAKKSTTLSMHLVPGEKPEIAGSPQMEMAQANLKAFNEKYAGKDGLSAEQLSEKVHDFKQLQKSINSGGKEEAAKKAEIEAEVKKANAAKAAAANKAAAEKLKKSQAENLAKNKAVMDSLGISEVEATGFNALVEMHGQGAGDMVEKFKAYEKQAKDLDYPISGFQYALLRSYINGAYHAVNEALRQGALSMQQHVYTKLVNDALEKLPKYTGTVTRGTTLPAEVLAKYKPGHVVQHGSFTSTGVNFKFSGNVVYKIKASGKRGADIRGANGGEAEVLFKSNTFFVVHKVETKNGTTHIEMEEVEGHG